jgi:hypothetical protein
MLGAMRAAFALALIGLLAWTPPAEAWQREKLRAGPEAERWNTPQRYGPNMEVEVFIRVRGRVVTRRGAGCTANFIARDLWVNVRVCGRGKVPIRVRYLTLKDEREFTFLYGLERWNEPRPPSRSSP